MQNIRTSGRIIYIKTIDKSNVIYYHSEYNFEYNGKYKSKYSFNYIVFGGWTMVSFNMCMVLGYISVFALNSLSQRVVNRMHIHSNLRFIDVEFFSAFWVFFLINSDSKNKNISYFIIPRANSQLWGIH